jgi:hypothetical protein
MLAVGGQANIVTIYRSVKEKENIISAYSMTLYLIISARLPNFMTTSYFVIRNSFKLPTKLFVLHILSWLQVQNINNY